MNSYSPIGGYFGLEMSRSEDFPHEKSLLLNSGRNCFKYILASQETTHVYLSKFTCDVMLEPIKKLGVKYSFYNINDHLEIDSEIQLRPNELIVYTNYFDIKDDYSRLLSEQYKEQLVLDNSQAFYSKPIEYGHTFYSPRKFFGVPDGGCLFTNKKLDTLPPTSSSYERTSHLLKRIDVGAEAGYEDFKINDKSLTGEPIKRMSELTHYLLRSIDYETVRQKRITNFSTLHNDLEKTNKLQIKSSIMSSAPMVYPYLSDDIKLRQKLIDNKIFVATYWPNVFEWCEENELEYYLAKNILPLPIDQRYGLEEMKRILDFIHG